MGRLSRQRKRKGKRQNLLCVAATSNWLHETIGNRDLTKKRRFEHENWEEIDVQWPQYWHKKLYKRSISIFTFLLFGLVPATSRLCVAGRCCSLKNKKSSVRSTPWNVLIITFRVVIYDWRLADVNDWIHLTMYSFLTPIFRLTIFFFSFILPRLPFFRAAVIVDSLRHFFFRFFLLFCLRKCNENEHGLGQFTAQAESEMSASCADWK